MRSFGNTRDRITNFGHTLEKTIKTLGRKPYVKVGILGKDFDVQKKTSGEKTTWPKTVGAVAVYNEFGTEKIPERSFVRWTADNRRPKWQTLSEHLRKPVIMGQAPVKKALGLMGAVIQGDMQARISSNVPPPNSPATIARKGKGSDSTTTLIDTGQMRASVHYEVVNAS